jgi:uncharacterized coiled-coil DUF342 family protein
VVDRSEEKIKSPQTTVKIMSYDEPTPVYHHPAANASLAHTMHELSCELVALRQEMRNLRDTVRELRDQVGDLRKQASEKNEQVVILRTQFKVLWAVAGAAGASGLGALVLELLRLMKTTAP